MAAECAPGYSAPSGRPATEFALWDSAPPAARCLMLGVRGANKHRGRRVNSPASERRTCDIQQSESLLAAAGNGCGAGATPPSALPLPAVQMGILWVASSDGAENGGRNLFTRNSLPLQRL